MRLNSGWVELANADLKLLNVTAAEDEEVSDRERKMTDVTSHQCPPPLLQLLPLPRKCWKKCLFLDLTLCDVTEVVKYIVEINLLF